MEPFDKKEIETILSLDFERSLISDIKRIRFFASFGGTQEVEITRPLELQGL